MTQLTPINDLHTLATNSTLIVNKLNQLTDNHWWDSNWFSAVLGILFTLGTTKLLDYIADRRRSLQAWSARIVSNQHPLGLLQRAAMTQTGGTMTVNGITTTIQEKPLGERCAQSFRSEYKYWTLPYGTLKRLLQKYEAALRSLPDTPTRNLEGLPQYKNAEAIFDQAIKYAESLTGENQWTIN